jgi:hypothetical protein
VPGQRQAVIVFDDGMGINVQSTVEQIRDEIAKVTSARVPLITVIDEDGDELWINADHIRAFDRGGAFFVEEREGGAHAIEGVPTDRSGATTDRSVPFRLGKQQRDR